MSKETEAGCGAVVAPVEPSVSRPVETLRFACHECGSKRWHWLGLRHVGETEYGDIEVDEYQCAECKTVAGW